MTSFIDRLLFPALFAAGIGLGLLFERTLSGFILGLLGFWSFVVSIRIIEQIRPFESAWTRRDGQLINDVALPFASQLIFFVVPFATWYSRALTEALRHLRQPSLSHIWQSHCPALVSLLLGIILYDLGAYIAHRLSHSVPLLWRFHSVHHSAPRITVINTGRGHPGNTLAIIICTAPIPVLLGMPPEVATWYWVAATYGGVLTHANIKMRCGILSYVLNTPELHRWHHSQHQAETDTNFGELTVIWDHLFGTYYHPSRRPPRDVGVDFPMSSRVLEQFVQPLTFTGHRPRGHLIRGLPAGEAGSCHGNG